MGFKEAVRTCLREKYFTFSGRASRSEYWWFVLFQVLVMIALVGLFFVLGGVNSIQSGQMTTLSIIVMIVAGLLWLYLYIPVITVYVRRFHDYNLSGWWVLAAFVIGAVPYVGFVASIVAFVITVLKGTDGDNKYGPDPLREHGAADVFA